MPEYVATFAHNVRRYDRWDFDAADDAKALAYLKECQNESRIPWETSEGSGDADALDPVLSLDRRASKAGELESVAEEVLLPGVIYFNDAVAFVRKVAKLAEEGAYNSVIDTLEGVVEEALALVNGKAGG